MGKERDATSGQENAKQKPFRLNGFAPDWQARKVGANRVRSADSSGRTFLAGFYGGVIAERLGFEMGGRNSRYETMMAHACKRCGIDI